MITKISYKPYISSANNSQNQQQKVNFKSVIGHEPVLPESQKYLQELLTTHRLQSTLADGFDKIRIVLTDGKAEIDQALCKILGKPKVIDAKEANDYFEAVGEGLDVSIY